MHWSWSHCGIQWDNMENMCFMQCRFVHSECVLHGKNSLKEHVLNRMESLGKTCGFETYTGVESSKHTHVSNRKQSRYKRDMIIVLFIKVDNYGMRPPECLLQCPQLQFRKCTADKNMLLFIPWHQIGGWATTNIAAPPVKFVLKMAGTYQNWCFSMENVLPASLMSVTRISQCVNQWDWEACNS